MHARIRAPFSIVYAIGHSLRQHGQTVVRCTLINPKMQTRSKRTQPTTAAAAPPEKKPRASTTPRKKTIKPAKGPSALTTDTKILKKASRIGAHLDSLYPSPPIPLDHASPFQLLVSVMLSAQTTDVKVNQVSHHRFLLQSAQTTDANQVTPALFAAAPDARAMASMSVTDVERMIKEIGLAPTKSKNLVNMSQMLLDDHNGDVPSDIDALELLPGVGHKTASVVVAQAFGYVEDWYNRIGTISTQD